jgi:thioredoxin 1
MGSTGHYKENLYQYWRNMITATFITDEAEFDGLLAQEPFMIVDCTATWCGPCKLIAPLVDRMADEYVDRAKVYKLDIDDNKALSKRLEVKSIPAVLFFVNGELVENIVGAKTYSEYSEVVDRLLG